MIVIRISLSTKHGKCFLHGRLKWHSFLTGVGKYVICSQKFLFLHVVKVYFTITRKSDIKQVKWSWKIRNLFICFLLWSWIEKLVRELIFSENEVLCDGFSSTLRQRKWKLKKRFVICHDQILQSNIQSRIKNYMLQ